MPGAAFQDQTATGKLKAEITPTTPAGCHCSVILWSGRSEGSTRPPTWRDRPTAKSQMSIISCTSPRPSDTTLPTSSVTSRPSAALAPRSSSPSSRTSSPRRGAGTRRQARNASWARPIASPTSEARTSATAPMTSPVIGERTSSVPPVDLSAATPRPDRMSATWPAMGDGLGEGMDVSSSTMVRDLRSGRSPRGPPGPRPRNRPLSAGGGGPPRGLSPGGEGRPR